MSKQYAVFGNLELGFAHKLMLLDAENAFSFVLSTVTCFLGSRMNTEIHGEHLLLEKNTETWNHYIGRGGAEGAEKVKNESRTKNIKPWNFEVKYESPIPEVLCP